jgi:hypothetical protein
VKEFLDYERLAVKSQSEALVERSVLRPKGEGSEREEDGEGVRWEEEPREAQA